MTRWLVTGGLGFIGSNLIRLLLRTRPEVQVVNLDLATYAAALGNLRDVQDDPRYRWVRGDVADPQAVRAAMAGCRVVLHLAAESHVDRSIADPQPFLRTNVLGTQVILDAARELGVERVVVVSTDEVYGDLPAPDRATEDHPVRPSSPYAASKAAADLLALAYHRTYGVPVVLTRCTNNLGPYQFPEKLIPRMITCALRGEPLPVYGDGQQIRDWVHVEDHCHALIRVAEAGRIGRVYNIGAEQERTNLQVVLGILRRLGKDPGLIRFVADRPGHDRRYALDARRIREELGWRPRWGFEEALDETVAWYVSHTRWWEPAVEVGQG